VPVTMSVPNPFRGRRMTWSWLHVWILLWLAALAIPTWLEWHWATDGDPETFGGGYPEGVVVPLALACVALGFAVGWSGRWGTGWSAAALGALVMAAGTEVEYSQGWSGGEPLPEPGPFVMYFVMLSIVLGCGAVIGAFVRGARSRPPGPGRRAPWS